MKPFVWINRVWMLVIIPGLIATSCGTHVRLGAGIGSQREVSDTRLRTPDSRLRTTKEPDAATKATMQVAYGKLPLHFEANRGQTDERVNFLSRGNGYTLFLNSTEAVLALRKPRNDSGNSLAPGIGQWH